MARRRPPTHHGVCIIDKPAGVTSHDVVGMIRRRFGERQVGHAGTLDPDATGVLVVAVGAATRLLQFATAGSKRYTGEVVFGTETDTLDAAGTVTATHDMGSVSLDAVRAIIAEHLVGAIEQIPPMVSALRVDGRRLHELAREGIEVERAARSVQIDRFDVSATATENVIAIDVVCSPGTYIRTLAADLGHLLGGGAHLRMLRRVASGGFTVDHASAPDDAPLQPLARLVEHLPAVTVDDATATRVATGQVLQRFDGDGPWSVCGPGGDLLAVYEAFRSHEAKPTVVLPAGVHG